MTSPQPDPTPTITTTPAPDPKPAITPEVQKMIDDAAKGARMEGERIGKKAAEDAVAAAKQKAEEDAALAKKVAEGDFETVKTELDAKRVAAETDRDTLKTQVAAYETALAPIIATKHEELKALGEAALKGYDEKAPAADRLIWLNERHDFLVEMGVITEDGGAAPGNGPGPKPVRPGKVPTAESVRDDMRRAHGLQPIGTRSP